MKPGKMFAHPSCDWAVENSGAIKFVFLVLVLAGICWFQGISLGLGPFISYFK
jgi:hypothetical protein